MTFGSQGKRNALSLWLPGLLVDLVPDPGLEMVTDIPQPNSTAEIVVVARHGGVPTADVHSETTSEETHQEARDWKLLIPKHVSEVYMADSPDLMDWDLEGFYSPEEELRGDVFMAAAL